MWIVFVIFLFILPSTEGLVYVFCATGGYLLIVVTSKKIGKRDREQAWPSIWLTEDKLKIKQGECLLWSKDISNILSAELVSKKIFYFKESALLLKSQDGDSYYLTFPKHLMAEYSMEDIVLSIRESVGNLASHTISH